MVTPLIHTNVKRQKYATGLKGLVFVFFYYYQLFVLQYFEYAMVYEKKKKTRIGPLTVCGQSTSNTAKL